MIAKIDSYLEKIRKAYEEEKSGLKVIGYTVVLMSLAAYMIYICLGYTLPDGLLEGLFYYHSQEWHLACGRWAVRYFAYIAGHNVVMPQLVVFEYALFIGLSVFILKKLFNIKSNIDLFLLSAFFIVTPAVIRQLQYPHVFATYAASFFLIVLAVKLSYKGKIAGCIGGAVSIAVMMGLYQSYIGGAIALVLMVAIMDLISGEKILTTILRCLKCAGVVVAGSLLNILIYTKSMEYYGINATDRVQNFTFSTIISELPKSVKESYLYFFNYFKDDMLNRNYLYAILGILFIIGLAGALFCFIKNSDGSEKKLAIVKSVAIIILIAIAPLAMNIIHILIPYYRVSGLMQYHYVLILPFTIALLRKCGIHYYFIQPVMTVVVVLLTFTYVISANATNLSLKASYLANETQVNLILSDIYDLEGYIPNATDIVFGGVPSEAASQYGLEIYEFEIGLNSKNQAFWEGMSGVTLSRMHYLLNYCGIDAGYLTDDDYYDIVGTEEFEEMPVWPEAGSVKMINGKAAVKLSYDYPKREEE